MNRFGIFVASSALLAMPGFAQEPTHSQPPLHVTTERIQVLGSESSDTMFMLQDGAGKAAEGQIAFFTAEIAVNHELVKNAPYTATAVTENTQTLADGTHITNKTSAFLARDAQGRTRREEVLARMGPLHVEAPKLVFISDPVANTEYILEPADRSVRIVKPETFSLDKDKNDLLPRIKIERRMLENEGSRASAESRKDVTHEDLGTQVIEGVSCQGRREIVTIPAGAIGNDRPLQITSENWYSPDLHTLVLRQHSDPRFGETVYRLTDIKLGEPDSSLFQVPGNYTTIVKPEVFQRAVKPESKLPKD
jgi:hypothetical protein